MQINAIAASYYHVSAWQFTEKYTYFTWNSWKSLKNILDSLIWKRFTWNKIINISDLRVNGIDLFLQQNFIVDYKRCAYITLNRKPPKSACNEMLKQYKQFTCIKKGHGIRLLGLQICCVLRTYFQEPMFNSIVYFQPRMKTGSSNQSKTSRIVKYWLKHIPPCESPLC